MDSNDTVVESGISWPEWRVCNARQEFFARRIERLVCVVGVDLIAQHNRNSAWKEKSRDHELLT